MGMKRRTLNRNHFVISQVLEDSAHTLPEDNTDNISPCSKHTKIASTSSSKRSSRRVIEKRVVSVPINDVGRLRMKGDQISAPPSDSWAWRKYGQKPIKGSPYPRGYYRCSSSKGCPARKQVERSRLDPNMLLVTYSCEHNHPWPPSRNHNHGAGVPAAATTTTTSVSEEEVEVEDENDEGEGEGEEEEEEEKKPISTHHHELIFEDKFSNIDEEAPPPAPPLINGGEFGWLTDFEYSTSCTMLESPILEEERIITTDDNEMAMIFTTREEDESLFGDLGELPECSMVFRRGMAQREVEHRRHSFATTG